MTAEVFDGSRMIRGYYRKLELASNSLADAEREVAEDVARMSAESE